MTAPWTDGPPLAVAELGQTAGSDVGRYVEAVAAFAEAGADAIKVQMLDPAKLASPGAVPYWQTTRYAPTQVESFARAGVVPHDGWGPVREACDRHRVGFIATPFDLDALGPLSDLAPMAVKVASGDITWKGLLTEVARMGLPVVLSTGASTLAEVADALRWLQGCEVLPLACSLAYPTSPDDMNLARIRELAKLAGSAGYSDHTPPEAETGDTEDSYVIGAAIGTAGARMAEKHCAYRGQGEVPDLDMALQPEEFGYYVAGLLAGHRMLGTPSGPRHHEDEARVGARRAIHILEPLPAGHILTAEDLRVLRPCPEGARPPSDVDSLIGKTLRYPVEAGTVCAWSAYDDEVVAMTVLTG